MSDQRQSPRVRCEVMLNKSSDGHTHICLASNISLGGMRLRKLADPLHDFQDYVRLEFQLPGHNRPIWIGAKKVYEQDDYVGLNFVYFRAQAFNHLRQWLLEAQEQDIDHMVELKVA